VFFLIFAYCWVLLRSTHIKVLKRAISPNHRPIERSNANQSWPIPTQNLLNKRRALCLQSPCLWQEEQADKLWLSSCSRGVGSAEREHTTKPIGGFADWRQPTCSKTHEPSKECRQSSAHSRAKQECKTWGGQERLEMKVDSLKQQVRDLADTLKAE
jgi:hypothetical protein